ncbi:hypothetical protein XM73_c20610 [Vibrio vulnificus]|nr:hypothetical protein XM73_c20610 [Vibrio vulnificus]
MDYLSLSNYENLRKTLLTLPHQQWYAFCRTYGYYNGYNR